MTAHGPPSSLKREHARVAVGGHPSDAAPARLELLALHPQQLADLMLAAPVLSGANLVTLEPGVEACVLSIKRGVETLTAIRVEAEVAVAAVVRLAAAAEIDLLSLSVSAPDGLARRTRVRVGDARSGELLVCVAARASGLAAEVRPLLVDGRAPQMPTRASLRACAACGGLEGPGRSRCAVDDGELVDIVDRAEPGGFLGVYHLSAEIGRGGMGVVLAGEHAFLGRRVAIKLLHRSLGQDPFAGRCFLAEARAAASLRHPSIVEVLDYGVLADGRPYIVMEHVDGTALDLALDGKPMAPLPALLLAREMAEALGAAHAHGIVHLDLKPANVLLLAGSTDEAPRIKLIDFGAAAHAGVQVEEGQLVGTPEYMAPERARGEPTDARSDLYALGVVVFELLTGDVPFPFPQPWRVFRAHMLDAPPMMTSPAGPLPEAVRHVVDRALKKRPDERYQSADEMVRDVDLAIEALGRSRWLRWLP